LFRIRNPYSSKHRSKESSVGIATGYGLKYRGSILFWGKMFLLHSVKTGFEAYLASSPTGIVGSFPGGNTAGE
jgi:hypothetical protein